MKESTPALRNEVIVRVTVCAGARKESVVEKDARTLVISVREPAEQNMANTRVLLLVARHFHVADSAVRIHTGHRSKRKKITVLL